MFYFENHESTIIWPDFTSLKLKYDISWFALSKAFFNMHKFRPKNSSWKNSNSNIKGTKDRIANLAWLLPEQGFLDLNLISRIIYSLYIYSLLIASIQVVTVQVQVVQNNTSHTAMKFHMQGQEGSGQAINVLHESQVIPSWRKGRCHNYTWSPEICIRSLSFMSYSFVCGLFFFSTLFIFSLLQ